MKVTRRCNPFTGVVEGQIATCDLAIGPRYRLIWLEGTITRSDAAAGIDDIMGNVTLKINGKPQRQTTALRIDTINTLMDSQCAAGVENVTDPGAVPAAGDQIRFRLPIMFEEPYRSEYGAQITGALPTMWPGGRKLDSLQLEVTIPADAGGVRSAQALQAYAETDDVLGAVNGQGNPVLILSKWTTRTVVYSASGTLPIVDLQRRDSYQAIHIFGQTADPISAVEVKVDNKVVRDAETTKARNDQILVNRGLNEAGLSAARFDIVFDEADPISEALPLNGVLDFQVIPNLSSAAAASKTLDLLIITWGFPD
jgi:hypothetical protein